jgi:hypothetical protein
LGGRPRLQAVVVKVKIQPARVQDIPDALASSDIRAPLRTDMFSMAATRNCQAYLDQHPNGHFAALARARLSAPEVM